MAARKEEKPADQQEDPFKPAPDQEMTEVIAVQNVNHVKPGGRAEVPTKQVPDWLLVV